MVNEHMYTLCGVEKSGSQSIHGTGQCTMLKPKKRDLKATHRDDFSGKS
jgi:hypothetical protein